MAASDTVHPADPQAPAACVPGQSRRCATLSPTERIVRQVQAVDAWIAARREREQALDVAGLTRDQRMDVAREVMALRRTHDAIKGRCARRLNAEPGPMLWPGATAVIAHRHEWFVDKLALLLDGHGVTVLARTDNGAEALGAIVAEQPDLVLAGDRLAMLPTRALLAETRLYAPTALLAVQASDQQQADALRAAADIVYLRHHPPGLVADDLVSLRLHAAVEDGRPEQDR